LCSRTPEGNTEPEVVVVAVERTPCVHIHVINCVSSECMERHAADTETELTLTGACVNHVSDVILAIGGQELRENWRSACESSRLTHMKMREMNV
jgi:hypothetical protein